uniref:non-specific serine/threonine protein kinase n=1 Tax=Elaeis guineensis var. tenera TaxID=51953 RepID=A0A8N4IBX6_ELAGV|nr:SNF1-related protein kinase catalytic subunit alpha KIN10 isoform X1 [Elaeis guineensis]
MEALDGARTDRRGSRPGKILPIYRFGRRLGVGSFAYVKQAEHLLTGQQVAIKILNRSQIKSMQMEERVRREIKILRLLNHPHIIRLYEVIETQTDIYFVMEYVSSGELFDYLVEKGKLEEDEARRFFQQIISGVGYYHRNMIAHRDLKPENLLLDSKRSVKIADFGLSNVMRDGHLLKTCCGSPNYAAPEVLSREHYVGPEVDVWSCGVILYALLCGRLPFDDENIPNLHEKIKAGMYTFPLGPCASAKDLISRMLVVDPMKRITIAEIRQHPWFTPHLPRYLTVPLPDTMQQAKRIDVDILQEVVKMGFDKDHLVKSLHNRQQNEATVSYYLLLDNQFRAAGGYLQAEFQETMEYGSSPVNYCETPTSALTNYSSRYMDPEAMGFRVPSSASKKWALGLQSLAQPGAIMMEVFKVLQQLNVCWKSIGQYNIKCRWAPGYPALDTNHSITNEAAIPEIDNIAWISSYLVKFEIQSILICSATTILKLYKTKEEKYLVDFQRVQGPHFLFLYLFAAFLEQLMFVRR